MPVTLKLHNPIPAHQKSGGRVCAAFFFNFILAATTPNSTLLITTCSKWSRWEVATEVQIQY